MGSLNGLKSKVPECVLASAKLLFIEKDVLLTRRFIYHAPEIPHFSLLLNWKNVVVGRIYYRLRRFVLLIIHKFISMDMPGVSWVA